MPKIVYEVEVETSKAKAALEDMDRNVKRISDKTEKDVEANIWKEFQARAKAAEETKRLTNETGDAMIAAHAKSSSSISQKLGMLADGFKKIKGDVDTLGGTFARNFASAADDVLGLASSLSGGGPLQLLGGITMAIGAAVKLRSIIKELAKDDGVLRQNKMGIGDLLNAESVRRANAELGATENKVQNIVGAIERQRERAAEAKPGADAAAGLGAFQMTDDMRSSVKEYQDALKNISKLESELAVAQEEYNKALQLNAEIETDNAVDAANIEARKLKEDSAKRRMEEAKRLTEKAARDQADMLRDMYAKERDFEKRSASEREQKIIHQVTTAYAILNKQEEAERERSEANQKSWEEEAAAVVAYHDNQREVIRGTYDLARAREVAAKAAALDNTAALAESIGMNVLGEALDMASGRLRQFGNINRDNAQEMLTLTPQVIDSIVAEMQARSFNMGLEAGKMSIMEGAHGASMLAQAAGHFSYGNAASGSAAMSAAGMHFAAGAAYAVLAQGSVGASLAIGATRGSGGLFGTGEAQGAGPYTSYAPDGGSPQMNQGGGRGGYGGGSDGRGGTAVTIVYEAGSINARDERQTAQAVSRGVNRARRDWFLSREMRSRS